MPIVSTLAINTLKKNQTIIVFIHTALVYSSLRIFMYYHFPPNKFSFEYRNNIRIRYLNRIDTLYIGLNRVWMQHDPD